MSLMIPSRSRAELLAGGDMDEKQRDILGRLRSSARLLLGIINDILDISRIDAGRLALAPEVFRLPDVLELLKGLFEHAATAKGLLLWFDVTSNVPAALYGDAFRLNQVLSNLVSNAIKYSPEGGAVRVKADVDDSRIRVGISDEGIGIAPEDQQRLFTKFYRVDSSLTREIGGTGLGLSICKSIIELLGGEVGVISEQGKGSTFWFTLPLASDRHVRTPSLEGPLGSPGGRILVVDDNGDVANLIATYLSRRGYEVVKAFTATEAWELALELEPRVITLDVMVDQGAGFGLLERLKDDPRTRDIPVVVLSIICDEGRSERSGCTDYLEKPIDKNRLISVIDGSWARSLHRWCS